MRQSLRISLALLISVVVFAAFAALAFTGLFDLLQVGFFKPRVLQERRQLLTAAAGRIEAYHRLNLERFAEPLKQPYILSAFSRFGQESREDIFNRGNYFGKLLDEYPALLGVRFLGPDGKSIHFSTFASDVRSREKEQMRYFPYPEVDKSLPAEALLLPRAASPRLLIDGQAERFIYSYPVADAQGVYWGTAVFYFSKNGLADALLSDPRLDVRQFVLIDRRGLLLNVAESEKALIAPLVVKAWSAPAASGMSLETIAVQGAGAAEEKQVLLSLPAGPGGVVGWLVPYSSFELQTLMKVVILASVFLTVFLLTFLLFNLRQDPLLVLSQRVKRFQLEILQEFIEGRREVDWKRWRDELAGGRPELRSRIKKGIGRLPQGKEAEIDDLIDRSWDEIIHIIEARIGQQARERVDVGVVEELIQKALERGRIKLEAAPAVASLPAAALVRPGAREAQQPPPSRESLQVEEIGVEEVTEAEEVQAPAAEPAKGLEQEAVEELEEAEPVEEAEEVAEEAAEVAEAEPVQEAAAVAASREGGAEAEALEELEAEEVQELTEEASAVAAPRERAPAVAVLRGPAVAVPEERAQPVTTTEEAEELPELPQVRELEVLPLEPQEQLEELPEAEPAPSLRAEPAAPVSAVELPAELEELEAAGAALPEQAVAEAAGMPVLSEQAEEAEPEELEGLEEEPAAIRELLESKQELEIEEVPGGGLPELADLIGQGLIRIYTLSEVEALVAEARTSVVMENGVYRIKEELRAPEGSAAGRELRGSKGLKALAEEALAAGTEASAEAEPGISELLGGDLGVDLAAELQGARSKGREARLPDRKKVKKIRFYGDGLDYDQFLSQFADGASDTGILKSLVEISRKIKAVSATILQQKGKSFSSTLRVGLMDKPETIRFAAGEPFYERFLKERQAVLILERPSRVRGLVGKFHPEDLKYMQGALFLPAVFQRVRAFLFLGLPSRKDLELKEIIGKLDIY
jgi:hypothetical protein